MGLSALFGFAQGGLWAPGLGRPANIKMHFLTFLGLVTLKMGIFLGYESSKTQLF